GFFPVLVAAAALGFLTALVAAVDSGFLAALVALAIFGVLAARGMVIFPYGKGNSTMSTVLLEGLPRGAQINGWRNYQITASPATISSCFLRLLSPQFGSCYYSRLARVGVDDVGSEKIY
ncbi:MAG: hypothetical protein P8L39_00945, partial [Halioglobus sp.]|nr:hypothetical protein [Halioglobus sp.]